MLAAVRTRASDHGGDQAESLQDKAARLYQEQQRLTRDISSLQAEIAQLSDAEKEELTTLLSTFNEERAQLDQSSNEPAFNEKDYRHFPDRWPLPEDERGKLPAGVEDMLRDAGVLDAVPWDGRVAEPTAGTFEGNKQLEETWRFMMEAGKQSKSQAGVSQEWQGFGAGIPDGPEDDDDERLEGDDEEFVAGEGVDEFIELLESGRPLPPDPEYEGLQLETAAEFTARIQKLKAAYEAQFLDRKDWKITPEDFKKIMEDKAVMDAPPWDPPEITRVQPAPDWGPEIQAHFDRFQWILFLLRKAHLQPQPPSPAEALISAGLAADSLVFEDPVMEGVGPDIWLDYLQRVEAVGGVVEGGNIWGDMDTARPVPNWKVFVDVWVSLPYPRWYLDYLEIHSQQEEPPNLGGLVSETDPPRDPFESDPDIWEPPPLRHPKGRGRSRREAADRGPPDGEDAPDELQRLVQLAGDRSAAPSHAAKSLPGEGLYLYLEELRAVQLQVAGKAGPDGMRSQESGKFFHTSKPWRRFQYATAEEIPWTGGEQRRKRRRLVPHQVTHRDAPIDFEQEARQARVDWRPDFGSSARDPPAQEAAKPEDAGDKNDRLAHAAQVELNSKADGRMRSYQVLTFPRSSEGQPCEPLYEEIPGWPENEEVGQAWRSGEWFSIAMTVCYSINNELGQVDTVQTAWGGILGHSIATSQDLVDLYLRETQLYQWHDPGKQRVKRFRVAPRYLKPVPVTVAQGDTLD